MRFSVGSFLKTIAVNNTAEPLKPASSPPTAQEMILQADAANSASLYIGGSDVSDLIGLQLLPGDSVSLGGVVSGKSKNDLSFQDIYVYGAITDKVRVLYSTSVDVAV